jgi:hypothetical protein
VTEAIDRDTTVSLVLGEGAQPQSLDLEAIERDVVLRRRKAALASFGLTLLVAVPTPSATR